MLKFLKFLFGAGPSPAEIAKVDRTADWVRRCPWKNDIYVERSSHIGSGNYGSVAGREYHNVYCAADGPNNDVGKTMHHGSIGFWQEFQSFEEANTFALALYEQIKQWIGIEVPVYASGREMNVHAEWCIGERKERPRGQDPHRLPTTFRAYEY